MPPGSASAAAIATRFATHWIADALAGDEYIDFSVLKVLVGASSKPLAGAPEFTRERVALRCIQEVSSVIAAGGDAADTAGVLRVDGAQSCQNVLFQLMRELGTGEQHYSHVHSKDGGDVVKDGRRAAQFWIGVYLQRRSNALGEVSL